MYNFLDFLRRYHYILLFLVLEGISFWLLFRFNNYQGSVWLTSANHAAAEVNRLYDDATAYLHLGTVNRQLTDENLRLQLEAEALRNEIHRLRNDSAAGDSSLRLKLIDYRLIPATVVSNTNRDANNYLVIDRGTKDGVTPEMGVVGGNGVVGIVYLTGPHYSLVMPVNNQKSSISCRVRGQHYFGYLQWDGSSPRSAYVDDIPRYAKIKVGEMVETSGYSAVFPPGIYVGKITAVRNSKDGRSYRLDLNLGTDFSTLRDVNVIATPYKAEIDTLRARAAAADAQSGQP